jgi:hypothetical protein
MPKPTPLLKLCSLLALLCVACIGGGCESYAAPVLSMTRAEPTERTPDGCAMLFTLDARNTNEDGLPLRTVEYRVDLNGREVFVGTRSAEATLRRLGTQQLKLPAVVALTPETQPLATGPSHYRLTGSMYYVTPGRLAETLFDAGVHTPSVGFSFEGDIDLSLAPFTAPTPANPAPTAAPSPAAPSEPAAAPK